MGKASQPVMSEPDRDPLDDLGLGVPWWVFLIALVAAAVAGVWFRGRW